MLEPGAISWEILGMQLGLARKLYWKAKAFKGRHDREKLFARASAEPRIRETLPFRLAFIYKDNPFELHSRDMALHLLRNYTPVKAVSLGSEERLRGQAHLTTPRLLREVDAFAPEVIFAFDRLLSREEVEHFKKKGAILITSSEGFNSFDMDALPQTEALELLKLFDAYLLAYEPHVPFLRSQGYPAEPYPLWADPEVFRPLHVEKDIDVLFIGTNSGNSRPYRDPILKKLAENFRLTCAGPKNQFQHLNARCLGFVGDKDEVNRLFNRSRAVIGFDRLVYEVNASNARKGMKFKYDMGFQIKDRTTCAMASGACYFVEDHEENRRLFRAGEEVVLWTDGDDLVTKIKGLLDKPAELERIGANARARVLRDYSVSRRATQLIERATQILEARRGTIK